MEDIKQSDINVVELQFRMKKTGFCQADIARELGVTENAVSRAIRGLSVSRRIHEVIAARLKTDKKLLWPSIYLSQNLSGRGGRLKTRGN